MPKYTILTSHVPEEACTSADSYAYLPMPRRNHNSSSHANISGYWSNPSASIPSTGSGAIGVGSVPAPTLWPDFLMPPTGCNAFDTPYRKQRPESYRSRPPQHQGYEKVFLGKCPRPPQTVSPHLILPQRPKTDNSYTVRRNIPQPYGKRRL